MRYREKLNRDFERFANEGIITRDQMAEMLDRVPKERRLLNLANVLVILAAILVSAALLSFIAANWDGIPRLGRVAGLLALCWASYFGAAVFLGRGFNAVGQGLVLLALATFGGSLALIGQMYHLPGDFAGALLLCLAMAFVAALFLRAPVAAVTFTLLIGIYLAVALSEDHGWHSDAFLWLVPLLLLVSVGLCLWLQTRFVADITAIIFLVYLGVLPLHYDYVPGFWFLAVLGGIGFAFIVHFRVQVETITGFSGAALFYCALLVLASLLCLQVDLINANPNVAFVGGIAMAFVLLLTIAAVLFFAGAESRALRLLCYGAFGFEVLYLYVQTVGTILGTSGFFLLLAVFVLMLAGLVFVVERRLKRVPTVSGDAA